MAGFEGTSLDDEVKGLIADIKVGGLILFAYNIQTPEQVGALCRSAQKFAAACGQPPLLIAIDQEGGSVARLKEPFTRFPDAAQMTTPDAVDTFTTTTATDLKSIGINMNMAPVLDVAFEPGVSIMARRAYGTTPQMVAAQGTRVIRGLQQHTIMAVAKHFPGIGRTTLDSHFDLPVLDSVDLNTMQTSDLIPFRQAVSAHVAGVMLSHIRYPQIDPDWPASLSPIIVKDLLRKEMGYTGVIMTDDLDMGAIAKHYDMRTVVRQIIAADIDLALICHKGPHIPKAFDLLKEDISSNNRNAHRQSVARIMALKNTYLKPEKST